MQVDVGTSYLWNEQIIQKVNYNYVKKKLHALDIGIHEIMHADAIYHPYRYQITEKQPQFQKQHNSKTGNERNWIYFNFVKGSKFRPIRHKLWECFKVSSSNDLYITLQVISTIATLNVVYFVLRVMNCTLLTPFKKYRKLPPQASTGSPRLKI